MAGYMHGDLLHQILCFMEEPSAVSLKRMHVTLSLVSNAWHAGVKRLKSDEYRKTPLVERAEVFRLTVPALHLAYDVDALLLGLRTYRSCLDTQQDIVLALSDMVTFHDCDYMTNDICQLHMRKCRVFDIVTSTMRLSFVSGDMKTANLQAACVSLLHALIVSQPVRELRMADFASFAGVFQIVELVIDAKMQCHGHRARLRSKIMQEEGMELLAAGLCAVLPTRKP